MMLKFLSLFYLSIVFHALSSVPISGKCHYMAINVLVMALYGIRVLQYGRGDYTELVKCLQHSDNRRV